MVGEVVRLHDHGLRAFETGELELSSLPARFHLNLTERCQLRCRHCITEAPLRSTSGIARDLSLEVLVALSPYLKNASYISLCHAGEPTQAPAFWPLMELVAAVQAEHRPVVHLMTNGVNLDVEFFRRATKAGVQSWLISVDGLSAESHDWLRVGSRIGALEQRIAEIGHVRRTENLDVRIGISWTVHRRNLSDLPSLPTRAAAWGLDVIKLEELYPINPLAEDLGRVAQTLVDPIVHAMQQDAKRLGIVVANHFHHGRTPRCRMSHEPQLAERCLADDFANRTLVDPCFDPYQTIFVEPDGTVKPGSFSHRGAGNLLERSLGELWNGLEFQGWRRISRGKRICSSRPVCLAWRIDAS